MELNKFIELLLKACKIRTEDALTETVDCNDTDASLYYMEDVRYWITAMEMAKNTNYLKVPNGSDKDLDYYFNLDYLFQITDTFEQYGHLVTQTEIKFT